MGCTQAIYACRNIVDHCVQSGNTINMCALDLSKAFDKMNHHALFIKLMKRNIPVTLLIILEIYFWAVRVALNGTAPGQLFFK